MTDTKPSDVDGLVERLRKGDDLLDRMEAATTLAAQQARIEALERALRNLENANDRACGARPQKVYDAMIAAGMSDVLTELDEARRDARAIELEPRAIVAAEYRLMCSPHEWTDEDSAAMARYVFAAKDALELQRKDILALMELLAKAKSQ